MPLNRRLHALPLRDIRLTDRFWLHWQGKVRGVTLEAEWKQIVDTGRLRNFLNAAVASGNGGEASAALCDQTIATHRSDESGFVGYYFNDSDIYKWCEAAAYSLAHAPHAGIQRDLEVAIAAISAAQEPSGYINTFFQLKHPHLKFRNLLAMHEMYCGGHLIEAGVALFETTGDRRLLDISIRFADHILSIFGPDKRRGYCGHQEIELALLKLAKTTGESKYRDLAQWMIEERGHRATVFELELEDEAMTLSPWASRMLRKDGDYSGDYAQDHAPIREHTEMVGHAVRAMYFYIAATEFAAGDAALEAALERTWQNLTRKRMYVTGGIGPSGTNEGFTGDYDLPNLTAYAETCAACGLVFWGRALLQASGNSEYADVMEKALYNGVLSGISLAGDHFFYANPLESRGGEERTPWFECACCPPNVARLIGSAAAYVASLSEEGFWIHIPAGFEAAMEIKGTKVKIVCESDYPWSGKFKIRVEPEKPFEFELRLRIPDWADEVDTELPGLEEESRWEDGYAIFAKTWQVGDALTVDFGMQPKWVECDPRVRDNLGRVALTRGPLVYCAEEKDLGFAPQLFLADLDAEATVEAETMLGGVETISVNGYADEESFPDELYADAGTVGVREASAKFVPYYSWCNRGPNSMQVWVRRA